MTPEELKEWRQQRGLNQSQLAEMLGVHWNTVGAWERGRQTIPPFLHLALAALDHRRTTKKPSK